MCSISSFTVTVNGLLTIFDKWKQLFSTIYVSEEIINKSFNKTRMHGHVMGQKLLLFLKVNAINNPCICDTKTMNGEQRHL